MKRNEFLRKLKAKRTVYEYDVCSRLIPYQGGAFFREQFYSNFTPPTSFFLKVCQIFSIYRRTSVCPRERRNTAWRIG
jgi:hypothetical protein